MVSSGKTVPTRSFELETFSGRGRSYGRDLDLEASRPGGSEAIGG